MRADRLDDLVADGEDRIERRHRILEHHRGGFAAHRRQCAAVGAENIDAIERHGLGGDLCRGAEQAQQRQEGHRLAGAGLADDTEAFAFVDVKADAAHGLHVAAMLGEIDLQALDVDKCHARSSLREALPG